MVAIYSRLRLPTVGYANEFGLQELACQVTIAETNPIVRTQTKRRRETLAIDSSTESQLFGDLVRGACQWQSIFK